MYTETHAAYHVCIYHWLYIELLIDNLHVDNLKQVIKMEAWNLL